MAETYLLFSDNPGLVKLRLNPILGFDETVAWLVVPTVGFFVHDLVVSTVYGYGIGFVIHGAVCLFVFSNSFRPSCQGFVRRLRSTSASDARRVASSSGTMRP